MSVIETFKKRLQAQRGEIPDVFQYATIPDPLRVQLVQVMFETLGDNNAYMDHYGFGRNVIRAYEVVVSGLRREMGVFILPPSTSEVGYHRELANFLLSEQDIENFMSAVELICRAIEVFASKGDYRGAYNDAADLAKSSVQEINYRLRWHGVGFEYSNNEIIKVDSEILHVEAVRPALKLLANRTYAGANEEFLKAYEHYRKGKNEEALADALKALESTLKTVLERRRINYDKQRDTANRLIQLAFENELVPAFWQAHFTALRTTLEAGVPTARNRLAGHGQGSMGRDVPPHLVAYVLHMTAAAIVFLAKAADG